MTELTNGHWMAEAAVKFVIEKLLRPIGIDMSPNAFNEAASNSEDVLNDMKQAVYTMLAHFLFANKQEARAWIRKCSPNTATDILRLMGYDPFLFNLDGSSQHLLITLCWLIWRADLFKTLYDPLLPEDETYLPPYGVLCADEEDIPPQPIREVPEDPDQLTARIQRLVGRITYQLQTLSDLEVTRETLHWQIRAIDPDSSLYALSLKAKPALLNAHTEALRLAVQNSEKLKEIAKVEQTFWRWAFNIVDNLTIDPTRFDETKSLPCDWYPPFTQAPFSRHNRGVDEVDRAMAELRTKLGKCIDKVGRGRAADHMSGLNRRQVDLITREIDDLMESLERMEEVKVEEREEEAVRLIPELPFKDFSDTKLQSIITKSERKSEEIARRSCPVISEVVSAMCEELGYQPHGWTCKLAPPAPREEEDGAERAPPKKRPMKAPAAARAPPPAKAPAARPAPPRPGRAPPKPPGARKRMPV
jgi:hypothetical protein